MLTIAIASGKGGTGKTLVATSLAAVMADTGSVVTLVDCDAEAPNDHLFFEAESSAIVPVKVRTAVVNEQRCTACGACSSACAYGAIRILGPSAVVFDEMCHGCGLCKRVCRTHAISEKRKRVGEVESIRALRPTASMSLITGRLDVGQVKTPDVIKAARSAAVAMKPQAIVLDAPPGVACAAVAAVRGADVLVLVTEPTPFGLHDLDLSVKLAHKMGIPCAVIVNRANADGLDVDEWCALRSVPVLLHIPFSRSVAEVYAAGGLVVDQIDGFDAQFELLARSINTLVAEAAPDTLTSEAVSGR